MARVVLRVRLVAGAQLDVSVEDPDVETDTALLDRIAATLADDSGVLRSQHGDRLMIIFGRGVAAFEVSPRGAVL